MLQTKIYVIGLFILQFIFWYIAILATWQSFNFAKSSILNFAYSRDFDDLSYPGYFLFTLMVQVGFTYFLSFRQDKINKMLDSWENYDTEFPLTDMQINQKKSLSRVTAYFVFSAVFSISKTVFVKGISGWAMENILYDSANDVAVGLFYWTPSTNLTLLSDTHNRFNATPGTVLMGISGIMANICWNLQIDCLRDLIMITALVNKHHIQKLGAIINECIKFKSTSISARAKQTKDLKCWNAYRKAHKVNAATNETFDHLLRIYHANGVMAFATFWSWTMDKEVEDIYLVFMSYNMFKILYTLFVSRKAAKEVWRLITWSI